MSEANTHTGEASKEAQHSASDAGEASKEAGDFFKSVNITGKHISGDTSIHLCMWNGKIRGPYITFSDRMLAAGYLDSDKYLTGVFVSGNSEYIGRFKLKT